MLKQKKYRIIAAAFLFLQLISGLNLILATQNAAAADVKVDPNGAFARINRMTLLLGSVYFYDSNTTDETWNFKAVGTNCPAEIAYAPATSDESGGTPERWGLSYQVADEGGGGGCGAAETKDLSAPKNNAERANVVLAGSSSEGKVISVMPTNGTVFKKYGTHQGDTAYIEQGVDANDCPLVVANNGSRWVLIPLEKKDKEDDVSNQIRELFDKELGVGGTDCGPTDNDDLGIFKQFGLPESYYDAGSEKDHYQKIDFGFDGSSVATATMDIPSIAAAGGIALEGPLKGGGYDGSTDGGTGTGDGEAETTSCAVDGIGWLVCPVLTFIGRMNDAAFRFLENILGIRPAVVGSEGTRNAWAAFRDIANVAFVIAFMVIVYSQITSAGISNYGIKKMLPRIVVAAILVNISFYICAIAVDISNILGSSIYSLLKDSIDVGSAIETTQWENSMSQILGIAATGIGIILLVVAITMAPAVLLAFVLIILILVARQALVILLIVISPLAFVAYLLPNTESWFKKWWKAFVTTLMVYPIVGLVFGASTLAASILIQVGQGSEGDDQQLLVLVALGVAAVPLFAVPAILKGSLSAAGSVGTKIAGLADRSTRMSGRQFGDRSKQMAGGAANALKRRAMSGEGAFGRTGWRSAYGLGVGGMMRGRAKRDDKYKNLEDRAKSATDTYLDTDATASRRRRDATKGQETAKLANELNTNRAKREHLAENHELHDQAFQSGLGLKDEQAIHHAESTQNYLANNAGLRTRAVQAGLDSTNAEKTLANNATTDHIAANSEEGGQYARLAESEGNLEIQRTDTKNAFEASAAGSAIADRKATAGIRSNIVQKRAETRAVEQNTDLNVQAQAATDTLEAAKAEESAFIQELRTEAGADEHLIAQQSPEVQATVQELRAADTQKRVQTQRSASASNIANVEYADQVADASTGLAAIAGGVDEYGAQRAVSAATQVRIDQFNKNVGSEQTTMSMTHPTDQGPNGEPSLREIALDPTQSAERRAAAAGMFMKSAPMSELHTFIDEIGSIPDTEAGGAAGHGAEVRRDMLMQVKSDMNRVPFALGDRARSAIGRGEYTTAQYGTHDEQLVTRVQRKMSGDEWRSMDPDDRAAISRLASTEAGRNQLGDVGLANLQEAFNDINNTPAIRAQTKVDARQEANRVAASFGFNLPFPETETP